MFNRAVPILVVILIVGIAGAWYWRARIAPAVPVDVAGGAPKSAPKPAPPVEPAATGGETLPRLGESDAAFKTALLTLPGAQGLETVLRPENLIRHLVATVDNLPRHKLAVELRPLEPMAGSLQVSGGDLKANLDEHNGARYSVVIALLESIDMHAVNELYHHYYPLFQRAYEDLGYPQKSFNERLIGVIDHLLQTPHPARPLSLVRPKVFWEFADPALEARSSGQKLMLRLGSENQAAVEGKLRELRALIATRAAPPPRTNH